MALINCKECGKEISDQAQSCPSCGVPLKKQPEKRSGMGIITALIIIGVIIVWAGYETQDARNIKTTANKTKVAIQEPKPKQPAVPTIKVTKGGLPACISEEAFDESVGYVASKDYLAFNSLIGSGECILLEPNIEVELEDVGIFSGKIQIRPKGSRTKLWTYLEAVEDKPVKKP